MRRRFESLTKKIKTQEVLKRISAKYFGLAKDHKHEIDVIMRAGATDVRFVIMSPTISGIKGFDEQLVRIPEAVDYCHKKYGATMTIGMDETSRIPMEYVVKAYKAIVAAGVRHGSLT